MHAQRDGWPSEETIKKISFPHLKWEGSVEPNFAGTLTLTSQLPDLWENKFLLFKPPTVVFCFNSSSKLIGALWTYQNRILVSLCDSLFPLMSQLLLTQWNCSKTCDVRFPNPLLFLLWFGKSFKGKSWSDYGAQLGMTPHFQEFSFLECCLSCVFF